LDYLIRDNQTDHVDHGTLSSPKRSFEATYHACPLAFFLLIFPANIAGMNPDASEETPLLSENFEPVDPSIVANHEAVYDRFSKAQKSAILAIVSFYGIIPCA
jgi:hypothetical protein